MQQWYWIVAYPGQILIGKPECEEFTLIVLFTLWPTRFLWSSWTVGGSTDFSCYSQADRLVKTHLPNKQKSIGILQDWFQPKLSWVRTLCFRCYENNFSTFCKENYWMVGRSFRIPKIVLVGPLQAKLPLLDPLSSVEFPLILHHSLNSFYKFGGVGSSLLQMKDDSEWCSWVLLFSVIHKQIIVLIFLKKTQCPFM